MIRSFAGHPAGQAVMTTGAGARLPCHPAVIKADLRPIGNTSMTDIARIAGGHMIRPFAYCNNVVMTVGAGLAGLIVCERQYKIIPTRTGGMT